MDTKEKEFDCLIGKMNPSNKAMCEEFIKTVYKSQENTKRDIERKMERANA